MPRPEGMEKFIAGHVNDPSRSPEKNEAAAKSIQEHFKLQRVEQEAQSNNNESALDFKKRMESELQTQFFTHADNEKIDGRLLYTMAEQCVNLVRAKYWNPQRRDLTYRLLSDMANNKNTKARAREMINLVLTKLVDQDKADAGHDKNESIAA